MKAAIMRLTAAKRPDHDVNLMIAAKVGTTRGMGNEHEKEEVALEHVTSILNDEFADQGEDRVHEAVEESLHHYDDVPVREFVPIMVEREAREALREGEDKS